MPPPTRRPSRSTRAAADGDGDESGIGRVVVWLSRQVEVVLAEHTDLTLAQYRLLALLHDQPEVASVLAERLRVSRPSVTTVADGLVARGLIERTPDPEDRRRVTHTLTTRGRDLVRHADQTVEAGLTVVMEHLGPRGARDLTAGLVALHRLTERLAAEQRGQASP